MIDHNWGWRNQNFSQTYSFQKSDTYGRLLLAFILDLPSKLVKSLRATNEFWTGDEPDLDHFTSADVATQVIHGSGG